MTGSITREFPYHADFLGQINNAFEHHTHPPEMAQRYFLAFIVSQYGGQFDEDDRSQLSDAQELLGFDPNNQTSKDLEGAWDLLKEWAQKWGITSGPVVQPQETPSSDDRFVTGEIHQIIRDYRESQKSVATLARQARLFSNTSEGIALIGSVSSEHQASLRAALNSGQEAKAVPRLMEWEVLMTLISALPGIPEENLENPWNVVDYHLKFGKPALKEKILQALKPIIDSLPSVYRNKTAQASAKLLGEEGAVGKAAQALLAESIPLLSMEELYQLGLLLIPFLKNKTVRETGSEGYLTVSGGLRQILERLEISRQQQLIQALKRELGKDKIADLALATVLAGVSSYRARESVNLVNLITPALCSYHFHVCGHACSQLLLLWSYLNPEGKMALLKELANAVSFDSTRERHRNGNFIVLHKTIVSLLPQIGRENLILKDLLVDSDRHVRNGAIKIFITMLKQMNPDEHIDFILHLFEVFGELAKSSVKEEKASGISMLHALIYRLPHLKESASMLAVMPPLTSLLIHENDHLRNKAAQVWLELFFKLPPDNQNRVIVGELSFLARSEVLESLVRVDGHRKQKSLFFAGLLPHLDLKGKIHIAQVLANISHPLSIELLDSFDASSQQEVLAVFQSSYLPLFALEIFPVLKPEVYSNLADLVLAWSWRFSEHELEKMMNLFERIYRLLSPADQQALILKLHKQSQAENELRRDFALRVLAKIYPSMDSPQAERTRELFREALGDSSRQVQTTAWEAIAPIFTDYDETNRGQIMEKAVSALRERRGSAGLALFFEKNISLVVDLQLKGEIARLLVNRASPESFQAIVSVLPSLPEDELFSLLKEMMSKLLYNYGRWDESAALAIQRGVCFLKEDQAETIYGMIREKKEEMKHYGTQRKADEFLWRLSASLGEEHQTVEFERLINHWFYSRPRLKKDEKFKTSPLWIFFESLLPENRTRLFRPLIRGIKQYQGCLSPQITSFEIITFLLNREEQEEVITFLLNREPEGVLRFLRRNGFGDLIDKVEVVVNRERATKREAWRLEHPQQTGRTDQKKKAEGLKPFKKMSAEELAAFSEEAKLTELLALFSDDPAGMVEALSLLNLSAFENRDVVEFIKRYVGLGGVIPLPVENQDDLSQKRRMYIEQVLRILEQGARFDMSDSGFQRQTTLIVRLSRKAFQMSPHNLIGELREEASRFSSQEHANISREILIFLSRVYNKAADYFQEILDFEIRGMKREPYSYQKEGAHFLVTHDRAILADEAGMGKSYQAIAAVETLGLRRVLWITTASNKQTLRDEILEHSRVPAEDTAVIISADPLARKKQIENLANERYLITNYETLVALKKSDPETFSLLTRDLDLVIVDEAQMADNPEALRTRAIQAIPTHRKWLLSASPYQSRPETIWTLLHYLDPEKFPSFQAFRAAYCQTTGGLKWLHGIMTAYMLRRNKGTTLSYFDDPAQIPFEEQVGGALPRIPRHVRLSSSDGAYELLPEQADLIAWMTADFADWVQHYNEHVAMSEEERINPDTLNALQKFSMIQKVIYDPESVGLFVENPLFGALDREVKRRMERGEKLILWGWNTRIIDELTRRYARYGTTRIDGTVIGEAREKAREDFQNDPAIRILVANYTSGGQGLTLTAAHADIYVQLPDRFSLRYQSEGRKQRLIGPNNVRHAKMVVESQTMVPRFPAGFVEAILSESLKTILSEGTLVEQTMARLLGGEYLFNLLLEGYGDPAELETYFKTSLMEGLGLARHERMDYWPRLRGERKKYAEVIHELMPLLELVEGNSADREKVLQLIEHYRFYPDLAPRLGEAFREVGVYYSDDLDFVISLFNIKNKYIRQQMLAKVPDIVERLYPSEQSLTQVGEGLQMGRLTPVDFIARIFIESGTGGEIIENVVGELNELEGQGMDAQKKRVLEEHFFMGVFGIIGHPEAEQLLEIKEPLFNGVETVEKIRALYQIGLLARTRPDLVAELGEESHDSGEVFTRSLKLAVCKALGEFAGRTGEHVEELIGESGWQDGVDHLLALIAGWQDADFSKVLEQFREILIHLLDGDFREWRNGFDNKEQGNSIGYMAEEGSFWNSFSSHHVTSFQAVSVSDQNIRSSLADEYGIVLRGYEAGEWRSEGQWVKEKIEDYRQMEATEQLNFLQKTQEDLRILGSFFGEKMLATEAESTLAKYNLSTEGSTEKKIDIREKMTEIRNLIAWMILDSEFKKLETGGDPEWDLVKNHLSYKIRFYRALKSEDLANQMETLLAVVDRCQKESRTKYEGITVEDTDDPAILSRMGALHEELMNCMNPNGSPTFTQFVVGMMGSKNMKMVLVKGENGEILATGRLKIKMREDGSPVLFLERGYYRKGYDFYREMLTHLELKSRLMEKTGGVKPLVMEEVREGDDEGVKEVYGTGAYTEHEYVGPVFGFRRSANVHHLGKPAMIPSSAPDSGTIKNRDEEVEVPTFAPLFMGIGTSNKSIETYIAELKSHGVEVLVDVRASPYSRRFPHFDRERFQKALNDAEIDYVWLGDTLGNPADENGGRTEEGFRQHMQTSSYREGMERLAQIIEKSGEMVAITCAEGREKDCHRKFILEDLRERWGTPIEERQRALFDSANRTGRPTTLRDSVQTSPRPNVQPLAPLSGTGGPKTPRASSPVDGNGLLKTGFQVYSRSDILQSQADQVMEGSADTVYLDEGGVAVQLDVGTGEEEAQDHLEDDPHASFSAPLGLSPPALTGTRVVDQAPYLRLVRGL